ncbi:MAG: dTMP kinase [Gammaproteobacteria bacterium]|nr:dTMP kinase [Gammaproteobacteria bacterium]
MKRGKFISVEGIEGVGKSTNIDFIKTMLSDAGREVIITREPGGTDLAEQIRELVLKPEVEIPTITELLLVFAARAAHVAQKIRPAVEEGTWVVCDRFTDATLAYQGGGRRVDTGLIYQLAAVAHGDLWPDLTLLLDAPVSEALARAHSRSSPDRFEREDRPFFERVRQTYLDLARDHPNRMCLIDASQPLDRVQSRLAAAINSLLRTNRAETASQ